MTTNFLYFAYGSNLLAQRIHINNPTAVRKDIGKLEDYRLDFNVPFAKTWGGCPATIVPHKGRHVWGAIWEIDNCNISDLDRQEGVPKKIYAPIEVCVEAPTGEKFSCRSYQLCNNPKALGPGETLPTERQPSQVYMQVIINGAVQSGLPVEYVKELEKIPNNGSTGNMDSPIIFQNASS